MKPSPFSRLGYFFVGIALFLAVFNTNAHNSSKGLSAVRFKFYADHVDAQLALSFPDMDMMLKFDKNGDETITAEEIDKVLVELKEAVAKDITVHLDKHKVPIEDIKAVRQESNFEIHFRINDLPKPLIQYKTELLKKLSKEHQEFVTFANERDEVLTEFVVTAAENQAEFNYVTVPAGYVPSAGSTSATGGTTSASASPTAKRPSFWIFLKSGTEHILFDQDEKTGRYSITDHVLFLLALLVVCNTFMDVVKIVTSFTVAHSITLGLAAMNVVSMPPRIVEPLIALTIIYVGLENIFKLKTLQWRWIVTFTFGLIHGFGFATAFQEMFGSGGSVLMRLLSFNLGVELGQILIAAIVMPLLWQFRKSPKFAPRWVPVTSAIVVLMGSWWLIERVRANL